MVRTDRHNHRQVAADSDLAAGVKALARAHQSMIWSRRAQANQMRSALREFYSAALAAFDDLTSRDAVQVLRVAPTPAAGAALSKTQIAAALRRGGRQRGITTRAATIQAALRAPQLAPSPAIAAAMGASVSASAAVITEMTAQIAVLEEQLAADFEQHPDARVVRSLPGLGTILGARVLGEFGDEPDRYATAKSRKNYAGTSPITRASGTKRIVLARHVRNQRLADAIYLWAFAALTASPRRPRLLRPAPRRRRHPPPGPAGPRQPPRRHPARLPHPPHRLQRNHRLGPPHQPRNHPRRLTTCSRGMSSWARGAGRCPTAASARTGLSSSGTGWTMSSGTARTIPSAVPAGTGCRPDSGTGRSWSGSRCRRDLDPAREP